MFDNPIIHCVARKQALGNNLSEERPGELARRLYVAFFKTKNAGGLGKFMPTHLSPKRIDPD